MDRSSTTSTIIKPETMGELVTLLKDHHIPIEKYGHGHAMPLQALFEQVQDGKVVLTQRGEKLIRLVEVVAVNVFYKDSEKIQKLYEKSQVQIDQQTGEEIPKKKTRRMVDWSVAKKILVHDSPGEKAIETLKTELQLEISLDRLTYASDKISSHMSNKFPNIRNHVHIKEFDLLLTSKEYKKEGYVFDDQYLRSYFLWKNIAHQMTS